MKKAVYLHFHQQELQDRLKELNHLGLDLQPHWSTEETLKLEDPLPDLFIVSLDRLPSHGRQYVQWLWEAKKRRHIPVIFVDGKAEKIQETKSRFPQATYCTSGELASVIGKL